MKLNEIVKLIETYDKDCNCVIWDNRGVQLILDNKQELINKLYERDMLLNDCPWGLTFSDNLIEVLLDGPQIG